jgi:hypothetical protein
MAVVTSAFAATTAASAYSANRQASAAKKAGRQQAAAGREAIGYQEQQAERGFGLFDQYQPLVQQGIDASGFLANPQAQYDFLQGNPLFSAALENANRTSLNRSAAGGRLGAGDTQSELFQNYLLSASPLIDRQRQDIGNLLNFGQGITSSKANILQGLSAGVSPIITDIGANNAAATIDARVHAGRVRSHDLERAQVGR